MYKLYITREYMVEIYRLLQSIPQGSETAGQWQMSGLLLNIYQEIF